MSRFDKNTQLQQILTIIRQQPNGLSISDIAKQLPNALPQRTLFRRLALLKEKGEIVSIGGKSATRYYINETASLLPLSQDAEALKAHVNQAMQQRDPVGYDRNFLYGYQPNKTFYLSQSQRKHLLQQGQQFNHELEPGTYIKRLLHRLLIDLSWNSSRLEGNTYSLLETEHLIEFGAEAQGKTAFETQMIINHKAAIEFMAQHANNLGFSKYVVLNIHGLLSNNLLANPKARGQLRQIPVGIGRTVYHPPEIPQLIAECFQQILTTAQAIQDPFEQAFFAMIHLPYLQPFEDVNKRVSRLVANIPFIKHNLSPLSFIDVPKTDYISGLLAIYELNKIELLRDIFIWAYERSAKQYQLVRNTLEEPNLFMLRYQKDLTRVINFIITERLQGNAMLMQIQTWAHHNIPAEDQAQFIRATEQEIASLHEGNIAIYQINPADFAAWLQLQKM